MSNIPIKPCPFCGHIGLSFREGSTFRWIVAECGGCGATRGEERVQTSGHGTPEQWRKNAEERAIEEWNKRV
ncbi:MAG: Lar family restriction alleviation protein [Casimicrobium sp.]